MVIPLWLYTIHRHAIFILSVHMCVLY